VLARRRRLQPAPCAASTTTKCKNRVPSPLSTTTIMNRVTSLLASIIIISRFRAQLSLRVTILSLPSNNKNNSPGFQHLLLLPVKAASQTRLSVWDRWASPWPWLLLRGRGLRRLAIQFAASVTQIPARTGCSWGVLFTSATFFGRQLGLGLGWGWGRFRRVHGVYGYGHWIWVG